MAARMYCQDYNGPPITDLPVALADYLDSTEVFICPEDRGSLDSYSEFFVARSDATGEQFVVGCPRHSHGSTSVVALGKGDTSTGKTLPVTWDGHDVGPGDTVAGGVLEFEYGSRVTISPDMRVGMLVSVTNHGRAYSIIWVPKSSQGSIQCDITPGSAFEVVTPAAIAGVQGTKFTVDVVIESTTDGVGATRASVQVQDGKVLFEDRVKKTKKLLNQGQSQSTSARKDKSPNGPKWGVKGKRYGHDK